jgi:hypothetical protein
MAISGCQGRPGMSGRERKKTSRGMHLQVPSAPPARMYRRSAAHGSTSHPPVAGGYDGGAMALFRVNPTVSPPVLRRHVRAVERV